MPKTARMIPCKGLGFGAPADRKHIGSRYPREAQHAMTPQSVRRYFSVETAHLPGERPDRETDYPCNDAVVADLKDFNAAMLPRRYNEPLIDHQAAADSLDDFKLSPRRKEALRRLNGLNALDIDRKWWADIIFKIFDDLDVALFGGRLGGRVWLTWNNTDDNVRHVDQDMRERLANMSAFTCQPGLWPTQPGTPTRRIYIGINADALLDGRRGINWIVYIMVHEMIHAYLILLCGSAQNPLDELDEIHGSLFYRCQHSVNYILRESTGFVTGMLNTRVRYILKATGTK